MKYKLKIEKRIEKMRLKFVNDMILYTENPKSPTQNSED